MKKVILTDAEKWVLLNKGSLISIPKNIKDRTWESNFDDSIKRIQYMKYVSTVYLRDDDNYYTIEKNDLPNIFQEDFFYESVLVEKYKVVIEQLQKLPNVIKKIFKLKI